MGIEWQLCIETTRIFNRYTGVSIAGEITYNLPILILSMTVAVFASFSSFWILVKRMPGRRRGYGSVQKRARCYGTQRNTERDQEK
ncbi:MHYT domain-containing protein [Effusibacillus dendaii]|uniref:MHYT domain-containing protein n=1 Tax=Effusibacillus dendaii TaxID=2743772 RepID=UPI00190DB4EF